jgi:hypothetical protein
VYVFIAKLNFEIRENKIREYSLFCNSPVTCGIRGLISDYIHEINFDYIVDIIIKKASSCIAASSCVFVDGWT